MKKVVFSFAAALIAILLTAGVAAAQGQYSKSQKFSAKLLQTT